MSATKPKRPRVRPLAGSVLALGPDASAPIRDIATSMQRIGRQIRDRATVIVTLGVGATRITHGLGRKPEGATVTPTVANATWAWALTASDERQITITCVGIAQPNATVEVFATGGVAAARSGGAGGGLTPE